MQLTILTIVLLGLIDPSPVDAFFANLMSTKVEAQYDASIYNYQGSINDLEKLTQARNGPELAENPSFIIKGSWSFDGRTTAYIQKTLGGSLFDKTGNTGILVDSAYYVNDKYCVLQYINEKRLLEPIMVVNPSDKYLVPCYGPWTFGGFNRFGEDLIKPSSDYKKKIFELTYKGKNMIMETYKKSIADITIFKKIVYNPDEDYSPVFARTITLAKDSSNIQDVHILTSARCRNGGFFPIEWLKVSYSSDRNNISLLEDKSTDSIKWNTAPTITKFKVSQWRDLETPVTFQVFSKSNLVSGPNGLSKIKENPTRKLTIESLGTIVQNPQIKTPSIRTKTRQDISVFDNQSENETPTKPLRIPTLTFAAFLIAIITIAIKLRSGRIAIVFASLTIRNGCEKHNSKPFSENNLVFQFEQKSLITNPGSNSATAKLIIKNSFHKLVEVYNIDAGCSCRQIDEENFPLRINPNESSQILMSIVPKAKYEPIQFLLNVNTNLGLVKARAQIELIPSESLDPESINLSTLYDVSKPEDSTFTFIHRMIAENNSMKSNFNILSPPNILIKKIKSETNMIGMNSNVKIIETTYEGSITSQSLGIFKDVVVLASSDETKLSLPIVWQRKAYVTFYPNKIFLGANKARAFISSPDDKAEIRRVQSTPNGVLATIISPKELLIEMNNPNVKIIDADIVLETNSNSHPIVNLRVVRFSN